jgi:hypothetical protein
LCETDHLVDGWTKHHLVEFMQDCCFRSTFFSDHLTPTPHTELRVLAEEGWCRMRRVPVPGSDDTYSLIVDEPIVLRALRSYLDEQAPAWFDCMLSLLPESPSALGFAWEPCVSRYLNKNLMSLFQSQLKDLPDVVLPQSIRIIQGGGNGERHTRYGNGHYDMEEFLRDEDRATMLIPHTLAGPDIFCLASLEFDHGTFVVPVFVQIKLMSVLRRSARAWSTTNPEELYSIKGETDPHQTIRAKVHSALSDKTDWNRYIIRILIAFPAKVPQRMRSHVVNGSGRRKRKAAGAAEMPTRTQFNIVVDESNAENLFPHDHTNLLRALKTRVETALTDEGATNEEDAMDVT